MEELAALNSQNDGQVLGHFDLPAARLRRPFAAAKEDGF